MLLVIDQEFRSLIPPLAPEDLAQLEQNLITDGCRDPLVTWQGILIDGHNRYEICQRRRIDFTTTELTGVSSREAIKVWIIKNQLGRRNLNDACRIKLALTMKQIISAKAHENKVIAGENQVSAKLPKPIDPIDTRKQLAAIAGVSEGTLRKGAIVLEQADDETKAAYEAGELKTNTAYKRVQERKQNEAEVEAEADAPPTKRPGVGIIKANMAIDALKRIPRDDEFRVRAFQMVKDWMRENR